MKAVKHYFFICVITVLVVCALSCKKQSEANKIIEPGDEFVTLVSGYTSGIISKTSNIRISLVEDVDFSIQYNEPISKTLFQFSPKIKGNAYWIDNNTIEFRPEHELTSGMVYEATFFIDKVKQLDKRLSKFKFGFKVIKQSLYVDMGTFTPYGNDNLSKYKISGTVKAADVVNIDELSGFVSAKQNRELLPIKWLATDENKTFRFVIDSVLRTMKEEEVLVSWDGKELGVEEKGKKEIVIPSLSDFKVTDVQIKHLPTQYIQIYLSDPIQQQDLDGLIYLKDNQVGFSYDIEGNLIKAFPAVRQNGEYDLVVTNGIKNLRGFALKDEQEFPLSFEAVKPAIKLVGEGVIMPNSSELLIPFEAVNLSAVDVSVIRIYENNVSQFLQDNTLYGNYNIKRVGRLIGKQTVELKAEKVIDKGKWNTFSIDVSKIIKPQPGAIYRVEFNFKPSYSLYPCQESFEFEEEEENFDFTEPEELSYWDSWDSYYYNDYYDYDDYYTYRENRENPCSKYYYGNRRKVARNILASDLGIIAKLGAEGSMVIAVTNLQDTKPIRGVEVKILDFQQQEISNGKTGADGLVHLSAGKRIPFLLIATYGNQKGYLRLDDGSSLSLSRFDVSGQTVQKGVKAFIYGERGVWRPGDDIYLNVILEDKQNVIPANHPVKFTLYDPLGSKVDQITKVSGENGFYQFTTATKDDALTGFYNAEIRIGALVFNKQIRIETIQPNRLKIDLDFGKDKLTADDKNLQGTLNTSWLHGALARNLKCEVLYSFSEAKTSFTKYTDFTFSDPSITYSSHENILFTGRTNAKGYVKVSGHLKTGVQPKGLLNTNFITRVYEESGAFSVNRFSVPYSPFNLYVGLKTPKGDKRGMLLTDTTHQVQIVTLDEHGRPVSKEGLKASLYKISWRWWWDASSDNLASYENSSYTSLIKKETIATNNEGKAVFDIKINYPDWGRYFVHIEDPNGGHSTGKVVYIDWPGWAGRSREDQPGGASMLIFSTNKTSYEVGEQASISLPGADGARALVSLENGSHVINAFWVEHIYNDTTINFGITPEMAPNCYVNVSVVQPHHNTKNDHPIRMYGVVPISVEDPATKLEPLISMDEVVRPESEFKVKVSEVSGKKMTYSLAIVDEGLLDITNFKTPDPWKHFYAREALGVKSWDMYDAVLGAYGGEIAGIFSIGGGDGNDAETNNQQVNRFKPVVLFDGPYTLEQGQQKTHQLTMPNYIGSVKVMVVAGNQGEYGRDEKSVKVKSPLMILATLPRVLGPGESIRLPVTIFAMEDNVKNVVVKLYTNDVFSVPIESKKIRFNETGDQVIYFDLKAKDITGIGNVRVEAVSGSHKASYDVNIEVRNPLLPITRVINKMVEPGETWSKEFGHFADNESNTSILEVSSIPSINLDKRLKYLIRYPHGCVEQTTSAAFPQLYLPDILDKNSAILEKINEHVIAGINQLKKFMLPDGGCSYWPGQIYANEWGTNYAGHFLLEAERKGYNLPAGFKKNWVKHQKQKARQWSENKNASDQIQAYRLYTLALAQKYEMGSMNRLRQSSSLSLQARWLLAATYQLAGQDKIASDLISGLGTSLESKGSDVGTYGSPTRDMAIILEALTILNKKAEGKDLAIAIANKLSSDDYMSTQSIAYSLMALSKYYGTDKQSDKIIFDYQLNGGKVVKAESRKQCLQIPIPMESNLNSGVYIKNESSKALYASIIQAGIPEQGAEVAEENNLSMKVSYLSMNDRPISIDKIEQGTNFKVEVEVTNTSLAKIRDLALSQVFPSGWEIHNSRLDNNELTIKQSEFSYQDIRDDRVYTYFDLNQGETKKYTVLVNAAYLGRYYMPSVNCEAMYNGEIYARTKGQFVNVIEQVY